MVLPQAKPSRNHRWYCRGPHRLGTADGLVEGLIGQDLPGSHREPHRPVSANGLIVGHASQEPPLVSLQSTSARNR